MGDFDPVPWTLVEETIGPPAPEVVAAVDEYAAELEGLDPYEAVKTVHDALYDPEIERTVPNLADPFVTAYLLEQRGVIDPDAHAEYPSMVERRPEPEELEELFWEREFTLWWIGVLCGVHPALVTFWCWEDDIPLMERNYTEESMERIREAESGSLEG